MNLKDYLKIYDNFIDNDLCSSIVNQLKFAGWSGHQFYNAQKDIHETHNDDLMITHHQFPEKDVLMGKIYDVLYQYIVNDLSVAKEWWDGWSEYSSVRFNKYDKNTYMKLHCDHAHALFDGKHRGVPVLTVLGILNDDYEGGNFYMWDEVIKLSPGSIAVFPSSFLYPHRVDTITSGTRYSYVSWAW